jgi:hypothetical protein
MQLKWSRNKITDRQRFCDQASNQMLEMYISSWLNQLEHAAAPSAQYTVLETGLARRPATLSEAF